MPTIADVAKRAKVSLSTASDILNGKLKAKEETVARVKRAVAELGYRPNQLGRRLRKARADAVGLVVPYRRAIFSSALLTDILAGIQEEQQRARLNLVLASRPYDQPGEAYGADLFQSRVVDGLLIVGTRESYGRDLDADVRALRTLGCPLVWLHYFRGQEAVDRVVWGGDNRRRMLFAHLKARGRQRVGFLETSVGRPADAHPDPAPFKKECAPYGLETRAEWLAAGEAFDGGAYRAAMHILNRDERPDALVCHGDDLAVAALQAALGLGLKVPGDLAIASTAGYSLAETAAVPITSFEPPAREMGRRALRRLQQLVDDPALEPEAIEVPTELAVRAST